MTLKKRLSPVGADVGGAMLGRHLYHLEGVSWTGNQGVWGPISHEKHSSSDFQKLFTDELSRSPCWCGHVDWMCLRRGVEKFNVFIDLRTRRWNVNVMHLAGASSYNIIILRSICLQVRTRLFGLFLAPSLHSKMGNLIGVSEAEIQFYVFCPSVRSRQIAVASATLSGRGTAVPRPTPPSQSRKETSYVCTVRNKLWVTPRAAYLYKARAFCRAYCPCSFFFLHIYIFKLKNVSCEYDRLNGWNSTLQAASYMRHVRWTCLFYISFIRAKRVSISYIPKKKSARLKKLHG